MGVGRKRTAWVLAAGLAAGTIGATTTASAVPAPEVPVAPPVGDAVQVAGANAAGDVYFNSYFVGADAIRGKVRHADGTTSEVTTPFAADATIAPDGALWSAEGGSLWSTAPDGTRTEHPIVGSAATATTGITEVETGPDGRIWFLDRNRSQVGSIAADGTGATVFDLPGAAKLSQLAAGGDGRMWVARDGGLLQALDLDGSGGSTYPTLGANVSGLAPAGTSLYATTSKGLFRISPDGVATVARAGSVSGFEEVGTSDGWAWFRQADRVLAVSASGRIAAPGLQAPFAAPSTLGSTDLAPDAAGGFVGTSNGTLVRIASGALAETFSASASVVSYGGAYWLRVSATGRTPAGAPLGGSLEVVLWGGSFIPEGFFVTVSRAAVVGRISLSSGRGSVDLPITADVVRAARPGSGLHTSCCSLSVRRPGTAAQTGLSSWQTGMASSPVDSYYGNVLPSPTMLWLDSMSRHALGRSMDAAGQVYWAAKLASGAASRTSVAQNVVGSSSYRRHRVDDAYQRWFGRLPSESERTYWADRLANGTTTSAMDLGLAAKPSARDVLGTTNAKRGLHLARALHLADSYGPGFAAKLDVGTPWATVVRDGYWSASGKEKRLTEMGERSSYTPPLSTLASQWQRTGDERAALVSILATLPNQTELYF